MTADVTLQAESVRPLRRRNLTFGLSARILGMVIAAVMTAEILLFLPSIARFRMVYLYQLIESGTLAALALDATPDNMVTEEVKRALLNNARVDTVVLVEPNKPKRALMTIEPRPSMPSYNLKEEGMFTLIWDALAAMSHDGARYIRVGGESMRLPHAMVWIIVDELPMRIAMYSYATRILVLSIIIALFTAFLLYLALRWLVIRPLQDLSADMTAFRREPEEPGTERPPTRRNDEIGVVDREFQNLQRELRASLRQKSRLAEIGAATNKINHDLRNMLSTARLLSDRLARSDDERTRALAPTILNTIDRAARLASDAIEYVRDRPTPRIADIELADLVDEVGVALQEQGEDSNPNVVRHWINECSERAAGARRSRPALPRVRQSRPQRLRSRRHHGHRALARQRRLFRGRRRRQRPRRAAGGRGPDLPPLRHGRTRRRRRAGPRHRPRPGAHPRRRHRARRDQRHGHDVPVYAAARLTAALDVSPEEREARVSKDGASLFPSFETHAYGVLLRMRCLIQRRRSSPPSAAR